MLVAIARADARWLLLAPIAGYGFAWAGHFFFEKNRPATFTHPLYSFAGDWVMFWDILNGRVSTLSPAIGLRNDRSPSLA